MEHELTAQEYLTDSHCHLDYLENEGHDIAELLESANKNGVQEFLTISTKISEFEKISALTQKFPSVYCSLGNHPHEAVSEYASFDDLEKLSHGEKTIGIGETGLDFYYNHAPRTEQIEQFRIHIHLAQATNKPLIVHTRDADQETISILSEEYHKKPFKGLIHCFSSDMAFAAQLLPLGFYFSFSGIVTFKSAVKIQEAAEKIPLDRILVETDAPFLAPIPYRGKKNQPAYVIETAKKIATIRNETLDKIEKRTSENFRRLFFA